MKIQNYIPVMSAIGISLIQLIRYIRQGDNPFYCLVKGYFNYLTLQVYLICLISEITQIQLFINNEYEYSKKQEEFNHLKDALFILSLSIYMGIVFIIIIMRNLQDTYLYELNAKSFICLILNATIPTLVIQGIFILIGLLDNNLQMKGVMESIQLIYIRALLLFSVVSSMSPILQVLLASPLEKFQVSMKNLSEPFIKEIKFKYVQLLRQPLKDEEMAELTYQVDQSESLIFSDELNEEINPQIEDQIKKNAIYIFQCLWNTFRLMGRIIHLIYHTIQLILAVVVIFGFVCIFIQFSDPNSTILSELNAINYFQSQIDSNDNNQLQKNIEVISIGIFKIIFIIIMYFSTNDCIKYSKNKQLIDDVNNLIVIIRKNLLNFSLIALLTTLYPNLTFTIDNSDCYKDIKLNNNNKFIWKSNNMDYQWNEKQCPITLIYLITQSVFNSRLMVLIGLSILVLYIITSIYILYKQIKINK